VAEWSKARALAAYHVIDEPGNKADYSGLGAIRETLAQLDSGHWAYANLLPTYGMQIDLYPDYLSRFINAFKPVVLSFDHYCITRQGVRPDYYQNQGSTGHRRPGTEAQNAFAPSRDPHRSSRFPLDTPLLQKPLAGSGLRG
jgi:hypothetical protein